MGRNFQATGRPGRCVSIIDGTIAVNNILREPSLNIDDLRIEELRTALDSDPLPKLTASSEALEQATTANQAASSYETLFFSLLRNDPYIALSFARRNGHTAAAHGMQAAESVEDLIKAVGFLRMFPLVGGAQTIEDHFQHVNVDSELDTLARVVEETVSKVVQVADDCAAIGTSDLDWRYLTFMRSAGVLLPFVMEPERGLDLGSRVAAGEPLHLAIERACDVDPETYLREATFSMDLFTKAPSSPVRDALALVDEQIRSRVLMPDSKNVLAFPSRSKR